MLKVAEPCVAAVPMHNWIDRRRSAVLLHITALPGPFHKGVLGNEAKTFIDRIASAGFSVWQFLPLGPTHGHGSPYESLSTFAGNPELIDLRDCARQGWLSNCDMVKHPSAKQHAVYRRKAGRIFWQAIESNPDLKNEVETFHEKNAFWLNDFALFSAIKYETGDLPWWQWADELRNRNPEALMHATLVHHKRIQQIIFEQFLFQRQLSVIKKYAESKDVLLFGDLPIYVAHDSSDVWAHQELFTLNAEGLCTKVAGVPPDYFSETGQRWGNPLYQWSKLEHQNFKWWIQRIRHQLEWMHILRIDHFLALNAYWAIPGERNDGMIGEWIKAPGQSLLRTLQEQLGHLPLIAEDLGIITEDVTALRKQFGLPGMKILHFAFGGDEQNPYLPEHHEENSVVYTGTHDNNTTMGWFSELDKQTRNHLFEKLGGTAETMPWNVIESALASPALLSVIPMQDLLSLGGEARFNTPGTLDNNWSWRLDQIPESSNNCWKKASLLNIKHRR